MSGVSQPRTLRPAAFLAIASSAAAGPLFSDSANVVELVPNSFNSTVLSSRLAWVIDFYADWCPHCIHFAPVWDQVAGMFGAERRRLRFGALNCAAHAEFCSAIDIGSFPTMRSFHLPGNNASYTRRGSDLHEGEYKVYEEDELVALIRSKLATLEGTGSAFNRTQGKYCSQSRLSVLSSFPANSTDDVVVERSRDACEVFCLGKTDCWGCSTYCGTSKCGWNAIPACGLTLDFAGAIRGGISKKRALPAPPAATTSTSRPPARAPSGALPSAALRWRDAEVALRYALRQGTALAASPDGMLQGPALEELALWLVFLARCLPSARARSRLTALAALAADGLGQPGGRLARGDWLKALDAEVIDQVPVESGLDPAPYWQVCRTYTCGLWSLFHIVTISVAEAARSSASHGGSLPARRLGGSGKLLAPPMPGEALARIRGFVAHFFGCTDCVLHFLRTYDSCDFGRCRLRPDDGPGAALWLWQVHNAVTKRVAKEAGRGASPPWPSLDHCAECWEQEGGDAPRWHSEPVYAYLVLSYWPQREQRADAAIGASDRLRPILDGASWLLWPAVLLVASLLAWLGHRRRKINSARSAQNSESFLSSCEDSNSDAER